jgi:molybdopterin-containing oxidoreductase family membrane subunit
VASSNFADGAVTHYAPSLPELLLGIGGLGAAFMITVVGIRALDFMPQDDFALGAKH